MDIRVAAYAIITDDDNRVLLAHWRHDKGAAWTLPGGGLEPGEDPADAARREVWEETGYEVVLDELLGVNSRVISVEQRLSEGKKVPLHTLRIIYRAHIVGGELRFETGGSTDKAAWFPLDEVAGLQQVQLVSTGLAFAGLNSV